MIHCLISLLYCLCDIILNVDCGHLDKEVPLQHPQVVLADVQLQVQKVQEYI